jgi:septal ring factor EnvC (AmiA/AmiB activator)
MADVGSATIGQELRRPVPLILLAVAVLGWIVAISAIVANQQNKRDSTARIESLERDRTATEQRFAELQASAGTAEDLASRIATAQTELQRIETQRDEARQQLPAVEQQVNVARQQLAEVEGQVKARSDTLAGLLQQMQQAEQRQQSLAAEITRTEENIADRSRELAEVGNRLVGAREQEAPSRQAPTQLT